MDRKPTFTITSSYGRKISMKEYGGKPYEMSDFFESRSHSWYDEHPSDDEKTKMAEGLHEECFKAVEERVSGYTAFVEMTSKGITKHSADEWEKFSPQKKMHLSQAQRYERMSNYHKTKAVDVGISDRIGKQGDLINKEE